MKMFQTGLILFVLLGVGACAESQNGAADWVAPPATTNNVLKNDVRIADVTGFKADDGNAGFKRSLQQALMVYGLGAMPESAAHWRVDAEVQPNKAQRDEGITEQVVYKVSSSANQLLVMRETITTASSSSEEDAVRRNIIRFMDKLNKLQP